jgi:hypothetical protein
LDDDGVMPVLFIFAVGRAYVVSSSTKGGGIDCLTRFLLAILVLCLRQTPDKRANTGGVAENRRRAVELPHWWRKLLASRRERYGLHRLVGPKRLRLQPDTQPQARTPTAPMPRRFALTRAQPRHHCWSEKAGFPRLEGVVQQHMAGLSTVTADREPLFRKH